MKVLMVSDVWPNNILGRYATHEKNQGNEVFRTYQSKKKKQNNPYNLPLECPHPDKIIASWNFSKNEDIKPNGIEFIEGGAFVDFDIKAPDHIAHLMPDYGFLGIDYALGRLTTGCPRKCPWCVVWRMWGNKVKQHDNLDNFVPEHFDKVMLLDDNILAFNGCHKLLEDLAERKLKVCFSSGLDLTRITYKKAEILSKVNCRNRSFKSRGIYAAFDKTKREKKIRSGIEILKSHNIKINLCYVLGGFPNGDEFNDLYYRVERLLEWGVDPYIMPYHNIEGMKANRKIRQLKRMITARYYRKHIEELGPIEGLERAWNKYKT